MTDVFEILKEYGDYLKVTHIITSIFRTLGWVINSLVRGILDGLESFLDGVYKLAELPMSNGVTKFINDNRILVFSVGVVFLIWFFIRYMNNRNVQGKSLIDNVLMGAMVLISSSMIIAALTTGTFEVAKVIYSDGGATSTAIYNENITDVLSFDQSNWKGKSSIKTVDLDREQYDFLDINQEINQKKLKFENKNSKEVFSYKLENNAKNELEKVKLASGFLKVDEHYYRYSWHPWQIFFMMIISMAIIILTAFKYLHAIYNIGYNAVVINGFAFSDFVEAAKLKKIIQGTINIMINVIMFAVSMKVYRLLSNYITVQKDINSVNKILYQIMLVVIVVEGPYIIQELTGYEGGLKSAIRQAATIGAAGYFAPKAMKKAKDTIASGVDKAREVGGFVGGMGKGAVEGIKENLNVNKGIADAKSDESPMPTGIGMDGLTDKEKEDFKAATQGDLAKASELDSSRDSDLSLKEDSPNINELNPKGEGTSQTGASTSKDNQAPLPEEPPMAPGEHDQDMRDYGLPEEPPLSAVEQDNDLRGHTQSSGDGLTTTSANQDIRDHGKTAIPDSMSALMGAKPSSDGLTKKVGEDLPIGATSEGLLSPFALSEAGAAKVANTYHKELSSNGQQRPPFGQGAGDKVRALPSSLKPGNYSPSTPTWSQAEQGLAQATMSSGVSFTPISTRPSQRPIVSMMPQAIMSQPKVQKFNRDRSFGGQELSPSEMTLSGYSTRQPQLAPQPVAVPTSISSQPGVQQFRTDLANSNKPLTNATATSVAKDKLTDWQLKRSKVRAKRHIKEDIGKNTGKELINQIGQFGNRERIKKDE